jgi:hypothetical protein
MAYGRTGKLHSTWLMTYGRTGRLMPDLYRTLFFPAISKNPDFLLRKTLEKEEDDHTPLETEHEHEKGDDHKKLNNSSQLTPSERKTLIDQM